MAEVTPRSPAKARPIKERFENAVKVIRSLPQEGPFQPSNTTKLRFYALYKQAREGPCNIAKPGFWDATGRAKWEAWTVCGKMSTDVAMQLYVEELQQMVETMPQTKEVEEFLKSIGPFYEMADSEEEEEEEEKSPSEVDDVTGEKTNEVSLIDSHDPNATGDGDGGGDDDESESSEESYQESFTDIPNGPLVSTVASGEIVDQTDGTTPTGPSQTSQTRLTSQAGQTSNSAVIVSRVQGGQQQRSLPVSAGNRGNARPPSHALGPRQVQMSPQVATSVAGEVAGSPSRVVQVGSVQSFPLAVEAVTSQLSTLQQNVQSMLQQLNTLALAVHSLTQFYQQGEDPRTSHMPHTQLAAQPQMGPQLITRRGRLLTLLLKVGPLVVLWPLVVNFIMSFLSKAYSRNGVLPRWGWAILTLLHAIFSVVLAYKCQ